MRTETATISIERGGKEYEIEARCFLQWEEPEGEGSGIYGQRGGWVLEDYEITSSELSGDIELTDDEIERLEEAII